MHKTSNHSNRIVGRICHFGRRNFPDRIGHEDLLTDTLVLASSDKGTDKAVEQKTSGGG